DAEVRLYDRLLLDEDVVPDAADWKDRLNPESLEVLEDCKVEPHLKDDADDGWVCQFERKGYFCVDPDSTDDKLVFNRTVSMRDQWRKIQERMKREKKKGQ
ncbi:MAG: glutamine--tRNA ligase, partial [Planctomycetota bacterium]